MKPGLKSLLGNPDQAKNFSRNIGVFVDLNSVKLAQSLQTAGTAIASLLETGFNVTAITLDQNNNWQLELFTNQKNEKIVAWKNYYQQADFSKSVPIWSIDTNNGLVFHRKQGLKRFRVKIDLMVPASHGGFSEDGSLVGMCQMLQLPYVGLGLTACAISYDKVMSKDIFNLFKLPTPPSLFFSQAEWNSNKSALLQYLDQELKYPIYVKPVKSSGSIGISRIITVDDFDTAVLLAFKHGDKVLVEEAITNPLDICVHVTGNYFYPDQITISFPVAVNRDTGERTKLPSSATDVNKLQKLAKQAFIAIEGTGLAKIDLVKNTQTGTFNLIEIDAVPDNYGILDWNLSGISTRSLFLELIRLADECNQYQR